MLIETGTCRLSGTAYAWRWKNHYLTTRGLVVSPLLHATQQAARDWADDFFMWWEDYQAKGGSVLVNLPDGSKLPFECFRSALQVPVL